MGCEAVTQVRAWLKVVTVCLNRMLWVLGLPASIISAPTLATSALRVGPYRGASLLHAFTLPEPFWMVSA